LRSGLRAQRLDPEQQHGHVTSPEGDAAPSD